MAMREGKIEVGEVMMRTEEIDRDMTVEGIDLMINVV